MLHIHDTELLRGKKIDRRHYLCLYSITLAVSLSLVLIILPLSLVMSFVYVFLVNSIVGAHHSALTTRVLHYLFYLLTQTTRGNWKAHSGKIFCDKETKARMHLPVHKLHKLVVALFSKGPQY